MMDRDVAMRQPGVFLMFFCRCGRPCELCSPEDAFRCR